MESDSLGICAHMLKDMLACTVLEFVSLSWCSCLAVPWMFTQRHGRICQALRRRWSTAERSWLPSRFAPPWKHAAAVMDSVQPHSVPSWHARSVDRWLAGNSSSDVLLAGIIYAGMWGQFSAHGTAHDA